MEWGKRNQKIMFKNQENVQYKYKTLFLYDFSKTGRISGKNYVRLKK